MKKLSINRDYPHLSRHELNQLITTIKGIVYARVSTSGQAQHGYSIESQIELSTKLAHEKYGMKENELLTIVDGGEMGDDPNRPAMNHVLWLVEQGVGSKVILLHPDRLARDLKLQLVMTERLWEAGCEVAFVELDVDPNNPESMLLYNIQGAIAQYTKAKILANSKRGRKTKALTGKIPGLRREYGYRFDKQNDTLVVNEYERDVYLLMVDWLLNGKDGRPMNFTAIARELSYLGIPAPNGDKWYQSTVSKILKKTVYTGRYHHGKTEYKQKAGQVEVVKKPESEWIEISVPALISDHTFEQIQRKMATLARRNRGATPKVPYLLKGVAKCGRCGGAVHAGPVCRDRSGEILYHYYVCSRKTRKVYEVGTGREALACRGRNWRKDVVDEYVWNYVKQCLIGMEHVLWRVWSEQSDRGQIEAMGTKLQAMQRTLTEKHSERKQLLKQNAKGFLSDDELDEQMRPLMKAIEALTVSSKRLQQGIDASQAGATRSLAMPSLVKQLKAYLTNGITDEDKKRLIDLLIQTVTLREKEIEIVTVWDSSTPGSSDVCVHHNSIHGQGDGGPQK